MEDNLEDFVKDTIKRFARMQAEQKTERTFDDFIGIFKRFNHRFQDFFTNEDIIEVNTENNDLEQENQALKKEIELLKTIIKDKEDIIGLLKKKIEEAQNKTK